MSSSLPTDSERPLADPRLIRRWALGFLALGIALRLIRWLLRYPLWHDEAFVAVNFISRGYRDLAGPLDYLQVCPILFLWAELTVVKLLGYNEWTLRLFPTVCAIGGLVLFDRLVKRSVPGWGYPIAVGIMAVAYSPIRHGNEVKSYATDLLAATAVLLLAVLWLKEPHRSRRLWLLAIVAPIALAGSLTAVFVVGGVALALLPSVWKTRSRRIWAAYVGVGLSSALTFLALFHFHLATAQSEWLRTEYLIPYWSNAFPPLSEGVLATVIWLARIHAGNLLAYPIGGDDGGSVLTLLAVAVGLLALIRGKRYALAAMLALPFALNLLAAGLGRYPYGGEARIAQHLAPAVCLLAGLGAGRLVGLVRSDRRAVRLRVLAVGVLLVIGAGNLLQAVTSPYHMISAARDREFARWFWPEQARSAEIACLKADLGLDFEPKQWITGISASYLCNQAIYAPRRPADSSPADRPLRYVLFHVDSYDSPLESPEFQRWMEATAQDHRFHRLDSYVVNADRGEKDWKVGRYWVVEFLPESIADAVIAQDPRSMPLRR